MNEWQKFLRETRQLDSPPRKSAAGIKKAIGRLTQTGPHTGGSPYKTVKKTMPGKDDEEDISAPPGAPEGGAIGNPGPAALEEEVEPESFMKQNSLQPDFWYPDTQDMLPKIRKRLMKIAERVMGELEDVTDVKINDVRLTGSLANYNWSKYSDVDLHIVLDFAQIDEDAKLVEGYLDNLRWRWNTLHNIKIYGHDVEVFFENIDHVTHSRGIYSVLHDKWVIKPDPGIIEFDYVTARKKADSIETQFNLMSRFQPEADLSMTVMAADRLLNKIYRMRKAGLNSPSQEYSAENIAFKILRREELIDKLKQMKYNAIDQRLTMGAEREDLY